MQGSAWFGQANVAHTVDCFARVRQRWKRWKRRMTRKRRKKRKKRRKRRKTRRRRNVGRVFLQVLVMRNRRGCSTVGLPKKDLFPY